jgi:hypothetical protein
MTCNKKQRKEYIKIATKGYTLHFIIRLANKCQIRTPLSPLRKILGPLPITFFLSQSVQRKSTQRIKKEYNQVLFLQLQ